MLLTLIPDWLQALSILALLATPAANPILNGRRNRARRQNPKHATAAEVFDALAVTAGPEFCGSVIKLPCRECGRRAIPPVDVVDSPWLPVELTTLIENGSGWQVTATCTACFAPLIGRVIGAELAEHALSIGVVPAIRVDH